MPGDIYAGLQALGAAANLLKSLLEATNATVRNKAAADLTKELLTANQAQLALTDQVRALEAEIASFEKWDAEKEQYELKPIGNGAVAYMLKPEARGVKPAHCLCPSCFAQRKQGFFQPTGASVGRTALYKCSVCSAQVACGHTPAWV